MCCLKKIQRLLWLNDSYTLVVIQFLAGRWSSRHWGSEPFADFLAVFSE